MTVSETQAKVQFTIQKIAIAWGFCLVVASVNRVAISDLGLPAALIAILIGVYTLFGPLQPVIGRITERYPIFGYRRAPYLLLGTLLGSLAFPFLPMVLRAMQAGAAWGVPVCFLLFCVFGLCIAMQASTFLDLLKDVTTKEARSRITTVTWTIQALAMAFWAWVFALIMPVFSFEKMQLLYNLSPLMMLGLMLLGVIGLETRLSKDQLAALQRNPPPPVSLLAPIRQSWRILGVSPQARFFFVFIIFSLLSVFLQDILQEIWAKDLFDMEAGPATVFQRLYNGLQTVGMAIMGIYVGIRAKRRRMTDPDAPTLSVVDGKRLLWITGALAGLAFLLLAYAAYVQDLRLFYVFYVLSAISLGLYVFPGISMMVDMTVPGQESQYLGLWSLAQVIGLFLSFTVSGGLYSLLAESGWLSANVAFAVIFGLQALMVLGCLLAIQPVSVAALNSEGSDVRNTAASPGATHAV